MTRSSKIPFLCATLLAAALLGLAAGPAAAQGTPAQRQACAPDAIKLCQDTIPDPGRTAACLRSHVSDLSPSCQAYFQAPAAAPKTRVATEKPKIAPKAMMAARRMLPSRVARAPRRRRVAAMPAPHRVARHRYALRGSHDTREARRVIGRLCANDVIDRGTCGFMGKVLTLAE